MRVCRVCGAGIAPGQNSREHVFPDWALRLLDESRTRMDVGNVPHGVLQDSNRLIVGELESDHLRSHAADSLVVSRVCSACNSGWMHDLEHLVQSFAEPFIRAHTIASALSGSQRSVLARWALKTVILLAMATPEQGGPPPPSDAWLSALRAGGMPEGIAVYVAIGPRRGIGSSQGVGWRVRAPIGSPALPPAEFPGTGYGFKSAFHIGALYLTVAEIPSAPFVHHVWREIHLPIWPPAHPVARFTLSPAWFKVAPPENATIIHADSLSLATSDAALGPDTAAWVGDGRPVPGRVSPEFARRIHLAAAAGPFGSLSPEDPALE